MNPLQLQPAAPADLCAALRKLRSQHNLNGHTVQLGGGTWDLFPEEAPETVIYPSNNDCGPARSPFIMRDCHNITLKNLSIDWATPGTTQAGL